MNRIKKIFLRKILKTPSLLGKFGEWEGVKHFEKKGYELIAKNVTFKKIGEIDLIFIKDKNLYFVEVKTRKKVKNQFFKPEDSVGKEKKKKYHYMATLFVKKYNLSDFRVNFLTLSIELDQDFNLYFEEIPF